jgi:integrative and conjugative element protein (TIGR02256 family)
MRIELAHEIEKRLRKDLRQAGRREIGGMLFAEQLAPAHFKLIDFSTDRDAGDHTHFQRDPKVHQQALDAFFDRTGRDYSRFNYLGEWHSHPSFPINPSAEDLQTMVDLVETPNSSISFALLLIVRLRFCLLMDYSLTVFARGFLPRSVRIAPRII